MSTDSRSVLAQLQADLANGEGRKALALIDGLPHPLRQSIAVRGFEAYFLGMLGRHEEEIAILQQLIDLEPAEPNYYLSLANALKTVGKAEEAVTAVRAALRLKPDFGRGWWLLADLKTFRFSDDDLTTMQAAIESSSPDDGLNLHFALGSALEQRGDYQAAFNHYAQANALVARGLPPMTASATARVDRAIATYTPDFFGQRQGFGDDSDAPIFILGLNRSGSTLIEQILASHSEIEATSELPIIDQLVRSVARDEALPGRLPIDKIAAIDAQRARALGAEYLERASHYRATGKPRFTDKMPANWAHVGFIQLILPNASIIDARRHPMAAGFSNFRQKYDAGAAWTFSLEDIGSYYAGYLRLMRHFDRVLPGKILHVINERLIDDFEPQVHRLLDHVGVPFEPACLEFHKSNRPVRSASAEQVRRPVNRSGIDQWRAFEPWLGPLKDALGPALEDWQE